MGVIAQFLKLFLIITSPVTIVVFFILLKMLYHLIYEYFFNNRRFIKRENVGYVEDSFFQKIFIKFPKRFVLDLFERNPNHFRDYGVTFFVGHQGKGKTIALVHELMKYQKKYPKIKIFTNFGYKKQDGEITCGDDLINLKNGDFGVVNAIDEIQTWYSSNASRNFPPHLLSEISYQRKQKKKILATSQVFSRVAKPIREQCTFAVVPNTVLGCITICRVYYADSWNDSKQKFEYKSHSYFFVHSKELREAYDTYAKVEELARGGFKEEKISIP